MCLQPAVPDCGHRCLCKLGILFLLISLICFVSEYLCHEVDINTLGFIVIRHDLAATSSLELVLELLSSLCVADRCVMLGKRSHNSDLQLRILRILI